MHSATKPEQVSVLNGEHQRQVFNGDCRVISINFGEPKFTPIRSVVSRSRCRPTGKYPGWKSGRMHQWETPGELNAFRLLDCDPDVTCFSEQPCEIVYMIDSELKSHYPDIYVETHDGKRALWEVKADSRAARPEIAARTKLLTGGLERYGFSYRVVLDSELGRQPRLQNTKLLLHYGRCEVEALTQEQIQLTLRRTGSLSWGAARAGAYGPEGRQMLCRLVLEGVLTFDMDQPLSGDTMFRCRGGSF